MEAVDPRVHAHFPTREQSECAHTAKVTVVVLTILASLASFLLLGLEGGLVFTAVALLACAFICVAIGDGSSHTTVVSGGPDVVVVEEHPIGVMYGAPRTVVTPVVLPQQRTFAGLFPRSATPPGHVPVGTGQILREPRAQTFYPQQSGRGADNPVAHVGVGGGHYQQLPALRTGTIPQPYNT